MKKAFTRVELLVVMALVAVLGAVLMPACSTLRVATRNASCRDNMHVIGVGLAMYGERARKMGLGGYPDGGEWLPNHWDTRWAAEYHLGALYPDFVNNPGVFDCPGNRGDTSVVVADGARFRIDHTDYGLDQRCTFAGFNDDGTETCSAQDNYRGHMQAMMPQWPLMAGLLGEFCEQMLDVPTGPGIDHPTPAYPSPRPWAWEPIKKDANHVGGANLLFYDYHVEWLPLVSDRMYPEHRAFEPAIGFIPNPYIEGDNCIYELEPDLLGETYIRYYNALRWNKSFIDMAGNRTVPRRSKDPTPPGWFTCW